MCQQSVSGDDVVVLLNHIAEPSTVGIWCFAHSPPSNAKHSLAQLKSFWAQKTDTTYTRFILVQSPNLSHNRT
jgi:hypothetical protein